MFPINKEFITSEELREQAAILERSAAKYEADAQHGKAVTPKFLQDLRERAAAKRAHACRIEAEACREDAAFLDAYRADVGITRAADALQAE